MKDEREDKNRKISMAISIGIHAVLALLFLFIMAWREPNPPYPEFGIELNFGVDESAGGAVQPEEQPTEEFETEETASQETESESQEESQEEAVEEVVEQSAVTTQESPVTVPEVKEEKKVEKPKEEAKEPVKKPSETKSEEQKQEEKKVEVTYPAKEQTSTPSQGDKTGTGDQGNPEGDLNKDALYGNKGGGGGSSFDLEDWMWDWIPKPDDKSNENGRLTFRIVVDANGEVLDVIKVEGTVSPAVERVYRAEVQKLTFSRKSNAGKAPARSTGTITFVIKSK